MFLFELSAFTGLLIARAIGLTKWLVPLNERATSAP